MSKDKAVFDFSEVDLSIAAEQGYKMQVVHPASGEPIPGAFITLRGDESPEVQKYLRGLIKQAQAEDFQARKAGVIPKPTSIEEAERQSIEGCKVRIISLEGIVWNGKEVVLGTALLDEWLKSFAWVRRQIVEASGKLTNFTKA